MTNREDWASNEHILAPRLKAAVPRTLCTDCGVSRSNNPADCGRACQFIAPDYPVLENQVHGRSRSPDRKDEIHFGPFTAMFRAKLEVPGEGAQWTGITTRIAEKLLEAGEVEAVLTMAPDHEEKWKPVPVIVTNASAMRLVRGMRMGYAPLLSLLEPARKLGYRRIAIIGIPCQIHALRSLEKELGFEKILVIGTPCSDNTSTENFKHFLGLLSSIPEDITYLEFRADYKVELRFADRTKREIPFLSLPISKLPPNFFPLTCRTCVDYTNALADITVGYMAGEGDQWVIVRNPTGAAMLNLLADEVELKKVGSAGNRAKAVKGFIANTIRAAGGLPLRRMPNFIRPLVSWLMPKIGPRGLEFARTRLEMKAAETIIHLRREEPAKIKNMVPAHVWDLVQPYDIVPEPSEVRKPLAD